MLPEVEQVQSRIIFLLLTIYIRVQHRNALSLTATELPRSSYPVLWAFVHLQSLGYNCDSKLCAFFLAPGGEWRAGGRVGGTERDRVSPWAYEGFQYCTHLGGMYTRSLVCVCVISWPWRIIYYIGEILTKHTFGYFWISSSKFLTIFQNKLSWNEVTASGGHRTTLDV